MSGSEKIQKYLTSVRNKISQKLRTQWTAFCFKNKTQVALSRQMTQVKKKNDCPVLEKKDYLVRLFSHQFYP